MEAMLLFDSKKPFFKGNLHTHTTVSDGALSPEEVMALYESEHYDFIALTDHWKVNPEQKYRNMLVLRGVELDTYPKNQTVHIVGIGMDESVLQHVNKQENNAQKGIDAITELGGFAILAHPNWSLNTPDVILALKNVGAAEIYNTFSAPPWNANRADSSAILDIVSTWGRRLPLVASDDSHHYKGEAAKSYIMLQTENLTNKSVVNALKAGKFYATRGPKFHQIEVLDDKMVVHCSPVNQMIFHSNLPWVSGRCRNEIGMQEGVYEFQLQRGETFVRCEIIDNQGLKAWTSPIAVGEARSNTQEQEA